jgi:hypothetical protein
MDITEVVFQWILLRKGDVASMQRTGAGVCWISPVWDLQSDQTAANMQYVASPLQLQLFMLLFCEACIHNMKCLDVSQLCSKGYAWILYSQQRYLYIDANWLFSRKVNWSDFMFGLWCLFFFFFLMCSMCTC